MLNLYLMNQQNLKAIFNCFSLCTRRLYGTYSEHRSPLVVLISRWTFAFLVLHNFTAMARYGAYMATKEEVCVTCFETAQFVQKILDEVALFLIVLAVPGSYLIAWLCQCICGIDDDRTSLEMDKIDKVYQEVILFLAHLYRLGVDVCLNAIKFTNQIGNENMYHIRCFELVRKSIYDSLHFRNFLIFCEKTLENLQPRQHQFDREQQINWTICRMTNNDITKCLRNEMNSFVHN